MAMSVVIAKWKELQNAKWCFLAKLHANKQNQAKAWQIMWNRGDCVFIEPGSNTSLSYSFLIFFYKDCVTCATLFHALTTFSTSVTSVGRPCSGPEAVQGRLHAFFITFLILVPTRSWCFTIAPPPATATITAAMSSVLKPSNELHKAWLWATPK